MIILLKILIAIVCWSVVHFIGERIEFDKDTSEYGRFCAYAGLWLVAFAIIFLLLSLF